MFSLLSKLKKECEACPKESNAKNTFKLLSFLAEKIGCNLQLFKIDVRSQNYNRLEYERDMTCALCLQRNTLYTHRVTVMEMCVNAMIVCVFLVYF